MNYSFNFIYALLVLLFLAGCSSGTKDNATKGGDNSGSNLAKATVNASLGLSVCQVAGVATTYGNEDAYQIGCNAQR